MDSIILEDMIRHYCSVVGQSLEELESCGRIMEKMDDLADYGWFGPTARCFEDRLRECREYQKAAEYGTERVWGMLLQMLALMNEC